MPMLCVPGAWLRTSRPTRSRKHAWPQRAGKHRPRGNKPGSRKRKGCRRHLGTDTRRQREPNQNPHRTLTLQYALGLLHCWYPPLATSNHTSRWAAGRGSGVFCVSRNSVQSGESLRESVQTHVLYYRSHRDEAVSDEAASVKGANANLTPA